MEELTERESRLCGEAYADGLREGIRSTLDRFGYAVETVEIIETEDGWAIHIHGPSHPVLMRERLN